MTRLCPDCVVRHEKWTDYRLAPPIERWRTDPPGSEHAETHWQRSLEALRAIKQQRTELANYQQALLATICATQHQPTEHQEAA